MCLFASECLFSGGVLSVLGLFFKHFFAFRLFFFFKFLSLFSFPCGCEIDLRASCVSGKYSTTELHAQPMLFSCFILRI